MEHSLGVETLIVCFRGLSNPVMQIKSSLAGAYILVVCVGMGPAVTGEPHPVTGEPHPNQEF